MTISVLAISLLGFAALTVQAADVTGQWTAQVPGQGGQTRESTFSFKVAGSQLTGSVTTPRGERPISDGKIEGDTISFTQTLGNQVKLLYKGTVSGNEIKFTREREGGQGRAQEFVAKRKTS